MGWTMGNDYIRPSQELPKTDPALLRPVKVRSIGAAFCVKGQRVEVGQIVTVTWFDAHELFALKRAEPAEEG